MCKTSVHCADGVWRGTQGVEDGHPRDVSFIPVAAGTHLWAAKRNHGIRCSQGPSQWLLSYVFNKKRCQENDMADRKPTWETSVAGEVDFGECGFYLQASGSPDSGPQASPVWAGILHRARRSVLGLCCQTSWTRTATCHWLRAQKQRSELLLVRALQRNRTGDRERFT